MCSLALYVPTYKIEEFRSFVLSRYNADIDSSSDEELRSFASVFIYGEKDESIKEKVEVVKVKIKSEEEMFNDVVNKQLKIVEWDIVDEVSWMPAVTKDTGVFIYAIEVYSKNSLIKRIVMKDKAKSIRFLAHLNKIFIKGNI